jgi:hypothetical protein
MRSFHNFRRKKKMHINKNLMILVIIFITLIATGLFLPGLIGAGDMEPSDPPGPTMKTLDEIPPTWSQKLDSTNGDENGCGSDRFECVMGGAAVLDKETGLVWEQRAGATIYNWYSACSDCYQREVSNRKGWRLPTIDELTSLVDRTGYPVKLPPGHPFSNVQGAVYWSSTTVADYTAGAWRVSFNDGSLRSQHKDYSAFVWCVRGGHGHDAY